MMVRVANKGGLYVHQAERDHMMTPVVTYAMQPPTISQNCAFWPALKKPTSGGSMLSRCAVAIDICDL